MIMRGGGATGADGRVGAAGICVTLLGRLLVALGAWLGMLPGAAGVAVVVAAGVVVRGGTAIGAAELVGVAGVAAAGGGVFGGTTTTDGGR
jgi:hypothetical protein